MSSTKLPRRARSAGQTEEDLSICRRLAEVRRSVAGDRGQSRFAAQLGLTPSTYSNYEKTRVPPPALLVRAAELSGADLVWLLTGKAESAGPAGAGGWAGNAQHRAILQRAAKLLDDRPSNLAALAAFLELLEDKTLLEQSRGIASGSGSGSGGGGAAERPTSGSGSDLARSTPDVSQESKPGATARRAKTQASALAGWPDFGRWVPIFGRAAAGLARFWKELGDREMNPPDGQPGQPSALDQMINRAAQLSDSQSRLAVLEVPTPGQGKVVRARRDGRLGGTGFKPVSDSTGWKPVLPRVRLVQLSEPLTDYQLTEFLESAELADRYRPLFGLRLDGDSMEPMFPHGSIVLCSPSEPARPGGPAVVRLAGQIGLTCKIYRPRETMVRLVPANDKYPPQEFPARQLEWALAVLGSVRLG